MDRFEAEQRARDAQVAAMLRQDRMDARRRKDMSYQVPMDGRHTIGRHYRTERISQYEPMRQYHPDMHPTERYHPVDMHHHPENIRHPSDMRHQGDMRHHDMMRHIADMRHQNEIRDYGYGYESGQYEGFQRQGMQASLRYPRGEIYEPPTPSGRLYRSKSDETLSVSSSRVHKRHSKHVVYPEQFPDQYPPYENSPVEQHASRSGTLSRHSEDGILGPRLPPPGRSPEGQILAAAFTEEISHSSLPEAWTKASIIKSDDEDPVTTSNPTTRAPQTVTFDAHLQQLNTLSTTNYTNTNHSKTDSGSNPDSGYGSKIYRPTKSTSSFNSAQDVHNSSLATSASTCTTEPSLAQSGQSPDYVDSKSSKNHEFQVDVDVHCDNKMRSSVIIEENDVCNNNVGEIPFADSHKATEV